MISVSEDQKIKFFNFPFSDPNKLSIVDPYSVKGLSIFEFMRFQKFWEYHADSRRIKLLHECKRTKIYPHGYNILHILCMRQPTIALLKRAIKMRIPFATSVEGKTPLHFLLQSKDLYLINYLFKKSYNVFEDIRDHNFEALKDVFIDIIKTSSPNMESFLYYCFDKPETPGDTPLPRFGVPVVPRQHFRAFDSRFIMQNQIDQIIKPANVPLILHASKIPLNHHLFAKKHYNLLLALHECQNLEIFRTRIISTLVEYDWHRCYPWAFLISINYFIFIALMSVHALGVLDEEPMDYIILIYSCFFLLYEAAQAIISPKMYFKVIWNYMDIARMLLLLIYLIGIWSEDNKQSYGMKGVLAFFLLFGYIKAIGYLRVINKLSNFLNFFTSIIVVLRTASEILGRGCERHIRVDFPGSDNAVVLYSNLQYA